MLASIDVGTNTVRMLIGDVRDGRVVPGTYYRDVTRLGGRYSSDKGLAPEAMERTLSALKRYSAILEKFPVTDVRSVGTLALRRAKNTSSFLEEVRRESGLMIEVVDGLTEATLSCSGVLSALDPVPPSALIFDVGGGSTEFIYVHDRSPCFFASFDLGVVTLSEKCGSLVDQARQIGQTLRQLNNELLQSDISLSPEVTLVGTAGTVTSLAALDLGMTVYDWRRVNNLVLSRKSLEFWLTRLEPLSPREREELPGIEEGRGDLIVPGLRVVLAIMEMVGRDSLVVSDFGLLEGTLLSLRQCSV